MTLDLDWVERLIADGRKQTGARRVDIQARLGALLLSDGPALIARVREAETRRDTVEATADGSVEFWFNRAETAEARVRELVGALDDYEAETRKLPLGYALSPNDGSTYNHNMRVLRELRSRLTTTQEQGDE